MNTTRARAICRAIESWFATPGVPRDFPWRTAHRDPYRSLVAEVMLQQTQASRVAERLPRFLERFPDIQTLARARETSVLAEWSGLGYYRRAKNLHAAAREVLHRFDGELPVEVKPLLSLPGVGRYTAGAIASIAHNAREPIADGNVARVLLRIEGQPMEHGAPATMAWVWDQAETLVRAAASPAVLNEGLMELGAAVCTPRNPRCAECPARSLCKARKANTQDAIPTPKRRPDRTTLHHAAVLIRDARGRTLVERRSPDAGLWAGLWQPPTLETESRPATSAQLAAAFGIPRPRRSAAFDFLTSHRTVHFTVWSSETFVESSERHFKTPAQLAHLALSTPHRRLLLNLPAR